jgi:hypothetical protein
MNNIVPIFTELINEEAAIVSGGVAPILVYDGTIAKIINADGYGKDTILTRSITPPQSDNSIGSSVSLPVANFKSGISL